MHNILMGSVQVFYLSLRLKSLFGARHIFITIGCCPALTEIGAPVPLRYVKC